MNYFYVIIARPLRQVLAEQGLLPCLLLLFIFSPLGYNRRHARTNIIS